MCCVYKHMSESGEVLYVGISGDPLARTANHEKTAAWFSLVRNIEVLHFPSREIALQHEAEFVRQLKPRFNIDYLLHRSMDSRERRRTLVGERHKELRAPIKAALSEIGECLLSKKTGLAVATLQRFAYLDVVPYVKTVEKIEQYLKERQL